MVKKNKLQVATRDSVKNQNVPLTKLEKRGLLKHNLINEFVIRFIGKSQMYCQLIAYHTVTVLLSVTL